MSLHYIDERVIIFHTFCVLIRLITPEEGPKIYFPLYLETKISASKARILSSIPRVNLADNQAGCRGNLIFASFKSYHDYFSEENQVCFKDQITR